MAKMDTGTTTTPTAPSGPSIKKTMGGSHKKNLTGRQKAAIFLVTLGSEISSEIFKHLKEDEIEQKFEVLNRSEKALNDRDKKISQRLIQGFQQHININLVIKNQQTFIDCF